MDAWPNIKFLQRELCGNEAQIKFREISFILPILFLLPFGEGDMPPRGEDEACLSQGVLP